MKNFAGTTVRTSRPPREGAGGLRGENKTARPRPFVVANFALTWDGRISTRKRTPSDFSSKQDKRRLLEIRSRGDAVLVGKTTVATENLAMGLPAAALREERVRRGQPPYPMRVLVTNSGLLDPAWKIFAQQFSPVVIYSTNRMPPRLQRALSRVATLHLDRSGAVDLREMMTELRVHYGVQHLVCEGGAGLLRSLLAPGLVDEIFLTWCPRIFGGSAAPTLTGPAAADFLPRSLVGALREMRVIGDECFARYRLQRGRKRCD